MRLSLPPVTPLPPLTAARPPQEAGRTWAVMAGGGTAGHVLPGLAVAEALIEGGRDRESVHFFLSRRPQDAEAIAKAGFSASAIPGRGLPRKISLRGLQASASILRGAWVSWRMLGRLKPSVILLQGGYVSASCAAAARLRRIPSVVLEANARPGMASRMAARWARACALAFAETDLPRGVLTGTPIRASITKISEQALKSRAASDSNGAPSPSEGESTPAGEHPLRARAKESLGVDPELKLVLVLGGSLGSGRINAALKEAAEGLLEEGRVAIRHVVGRRAWKEENRKEKNRSAATLDRSGGRYAVIPFEDDMATALSAADLVVSRAGGGAVAELAAAARPSVLIPMEESAEGHQSANAKAMELSGASVVLTEADLSASTLASTLKDLLAHPSRLSAMAEMAANLARPDAARRVADLLEAQVKA